MSTEREELEDAVFDARARYIGAHGAYWNSMQFSASSGPTHFLSWPKPSCPTSTDDEKDQRRKEMELAKTEFENAEYSFNSASHGGAL